jgi:hypothetical protein
MLSERYFKKWPILTDDTGDVAKSKQFKGHDEFFCRFEII